MCVWENVKFRTNCCDNIDRKNDICSFIGWEDLHGSIATFSRTVPMMIAIKWTCFEITRTTRLVAFARFWRAIRSVGTMCALCKTDNFLFDWLCTNLDACVSKKICCGMCDIRKIQSNYKSDISSFLRTIFVEKVDLDCFYFIDKIPVWECKRLLNLLDNRVPCFREWWKTFAWSMMRCKTNTVRFCLICAHDVSVWIEMEWSKCWPKLAVQSDSKVARCKCEKTRELSAWRA